LLASLQTETLVLKNHAVTTYSLAPANQVWSTDNY